MKTYAVKANDIKRQWHVIDADGQVLGKIATQAANLLSGKHKPLFARNADVGDFVVVINAARVRFTGKKLEQKKYYSHSGYPGGLKEVSLALQMERAPEVVIEHAVKGMLPRNKLNAKMMKRLRIYSGAQYPAKTEKATAAAAPKPEQSTKQA
jgi:large subunit ribosomal protein L13